MRISDWSSDVCSSDLRRKDRCEIRQFQRQSGQACFRRKRQGLFEVMPNMDAVPVVGIARLHQIGFEAEFDRDGQRMRSARRSDPDACRRAAGKARGILHENVDQRSEEHTSELQSLMRISYAVFCLKKKNITHKRST